MLDSNKDNQKLDAMKRIIGVSLTGNLGTGKCYRHEDLKIMLDSNKDNQKFGAMKIVIGLSLIGNRKFLWGGGKGVQTLELSDKEKLGRFSFLNNKTGFFMVIKLFMHDTYFCLLNSII